MCQISAALLFRGVPLICFWIFLLSCTALNQRWCKFMGGIKNNRELKHRRLWGTDGNWKSFVCFSAHFCSSRWMEKLLLDVCGLTLQTWWCQNAPKRKKINFQLPSVAHEGLCLSSLMVHYNSLILSAWMRLICFGVYMYHLWFWSGEGFLIWTSLPSAKSNLVSCFPSQPLSVFCVHV